MAALLLSRTLPAADRNVFRPAPPKTPPDYLSEPEVIRLRPVNFNFSAFNKRKVPVRMRLNFSRGAEPVVIWEKVEPAAGGDGWAWTGRIAGTEFGSAALVLTNGAVTGNVNTGGGTIWQIRTAPDTSIWVREVRPRRRKD